MGKDNKDFLKKKKKLGQQAKSATATDLRFRTRAIFMPEQSVKQEHGDFVTHRNMSLSDLLPQVKHHNDNVRKDALLQMRDLLTKYPHLLDLHLAEICERVVECIVDLERNVRQALHTFLAGLFPLVSEEVIAPFFPLFIVYMTSALTHLKQSIRVDALGFINIWIKHFPALVAAEHFKFLRHYITVLSHREPTAVSQVRVNSSYTASLEITGEKVRRLIRTDKHAQKIDKYMKKKAGAPTYNQVRVQIIDSLCQLLRCTFASLDSASDNKLDGGYANSLTEDFENLEGDAVVTSREKNPREYEWTNRGRNEIDLTIFPTLRSTSITLQSVFEGMEVKRSIMMRNADSNSSGSGNVDAGADSDYRLDIDTRGEGGLLDYLKKLFPTLITIWIECDPGVITASSQITALLAVAEAMHLLVNRTCEKLPAIDGDHSFLSEVLRPCLTEIAKHVLPHFPIESPAGWSENERHEVASLNTTLSMLFCNFLHFRGDKGAKEDSTPLDSINDFLSAVTDFTGSLFRVGKATKQKKSASADDMDVDTPASSPAGFTKPDFVLMVSMFPTLQRLIRDRAYVTPAQRQRIIQCFNKCFAECSAKSATKRACVFFIRDLLLSDQATVALLPSDAVKSWLENLPKILWQLQDSNPTASLAILRLLKFYSQRFGAGSVDESTSSISNLQLALVPFFYTEITTEKRGQTVKRELFGPFVSLPEDVQRAAIELIYYFNGVLSQNMFTALIKCMCHSKRVTIESERDADAMDTDDTPSSQATQLEYSVSVGALRYLLETLTADRHFTSPSSYIGFFVSMVLSTCKPLKNATDALTAPEDALVRSRIRKVASLAARCCSMLGMGKDLLDSVSQTLRPVLEKSTSNLVQMGALYLINKIIGYSGALVYALPDTLAREHFLARSIQRYLTTVFEQTGKDVDLKPAKRLFLSYPGVVLSPLLEDLAANHAGSAFAKALLDALIVTQQDTFKPCLKATKDVLTKTIERLAAAGTSSLIIDRLRTELEIALTSEQ
eukprot:TRINITY_DN4459_c0_g1_i1.p1 TRINITY_DN4459_c0_g1~~TRINITY_DN4459_c0_g1_i1.p1  ORF type:complete len:1014 (-),score=207.45 TRINITY_DN4459_c0_g1_i1:937-3978(-)